MRELRIIRCTANLSFLPAMDGAGQTAENCQASGGHPGWYPVIPIREKNHKLMLELNGLLIYNIFKGQR
jgi:hypothetical protein